MRNSFFVLSTFVLAISGHLMSCNNDAKKPFIEKSSFIKASLVNDSLETLHLNETRVYRKIVEKKILKNKKIIDDSYLHVARALDWQRTSDFQKRNLFLKKKMDDYNGERKEELELFKIDLNSDLGELDKALADW
jgi:hypothetical protein